MTIETQEGRVLVTGGAGFIGSHLVDYLVSLGKQVVVLDDFSTGYRHNLTEAKASGAVTIVNGSVLDQSILDEVISGIDVVYHLAVQCVRRSLGSPLENHKINATGTLNVLEAARQARVSRFVYCSSSEVYGDCNDNRLNEETSVPLPTTVYGAAKLVGEHYTRAYYNTYGLQTVIVRPFNAYGPREHCVGDLAEVIPRFAIRILNGEPPVIFGDGKQTRDFTYVTDVARGLAISGLSDKTVGKVINIAFGVGRSVNEVADALLRLCQRPDIKPQRLDPRPGDVRALQADTRQSLALLNFEPTMDFEEGLNHFLQWLGLQYPDLSGFKSDPVQNWVLGRT